MDVDADSGDTGPGGSVFEFVGGRACLDFVGTVAERRTTALERLRVPADLQRWIGQAHLLDRPPAVSAAQLVRAREVREALFAVLAAALDGTPAPPSARELLNTTALRPPVGLHLGDAGAVERSGDLDAVLSGLVRDCFDLLSGPQRAALSWCDDERCTRVFVDTSRGRRRRWCGMSGCGDRAKAAAYRRRRAGVPTG
ncbi:putative RNA-binding Zn ribbon-like protein [Kineococcus rhizosphaerae]|uniref:Putative RNA-binding Zn ribbon-like protein n=1 Tax=Kineococcus rhizosphaerae TaxID=559628 RepID=A0A2T0R0I9_9ACTN|nr:putative RNA-binding Zn ribbon-like protein [Kineococcus rhizosphaerae]